MTTAAAKPPVRTPLISSRHQK